MIHDFLDFIHKITDPDELAILIDTVFSGWWIYIVMVAIVYAENAILLGFILPGDSLLFTLGVVAGTGKINVWLLMGVLVVAAIAGDSTGYFLGKKTGPAIFSRPDSRLFKQEYVRRTQSFFERYGGKTILMARFVPVIRSFAPFMAGVGKMPYRTFVFYNVIGSFIWVVVLTMLGFWLGNVPWIKENFEKAILLVVALSFVPAVIEIINHRRRSKREVR
jgi:membrane-associated protein